MTVYDGVLFIIPGREIYLGETTTRELYKKIAAWAKDATAADYFVISFQDAGIRAVSSDEYPDFPIPPGVIRDKPIVIMSGVIESTQTGRAYSVYANEFMEDFESVLNLEHAPNGVRVIGYDWNNDLITGYVYESAEAEEQHG